MARKTKVIGFSVAPEVAHQYERLARRRRVTKSELFRQMLDSYRRSVEEDEFRALQRRMSGRFKGRKKLSEKDVERIVFEDR